MHGRRLPPGLFAAQVRAGDEAGQRRQAIGVAAAGRLQEPRQRRRRVGSRFVARDDAGGGIRDRDGTAGMNVRGRVLATRSIEGERVHAVGATEADGSAGEPGGSLGEQLRKRCAGSGRAGRQSL